MARAASAGSTPPRPVPIPGMAMRSMLLRAAASSAARVARLTFSTPIFIPGCSIVGAWITILANSVPALVTTAAPTAIGASDIASFWMAGPPLRDRAADTPPPIIPSEFAGLTTASTAMRVISDLARCICMKGKARGAPYLNIPPAPIAKSDQRILREHQVQLLLDLVGVGGAGHRELLNDEAPGGVQHPALTEGERLHPLEAIEITKDLG